MGVKDDFTGLKPTALSYISATVREQVSHRKPQCLDHQSPESVRGAGVVEEVRVHWNVVEGFRRDGRGCTEF